MFQDTRPWETCATAGTQWAYKPEDKLRSIEECLHGLVRCAIGVNVPAARRHAVDTIVKLELDGPARSIAAIRPA